MKGFAAKAATVVVVGGLAAAVAMADLPAPGPAPAPAPSPAQEDLEIVKVKLLVEQVKLDAVKAQGNASSQKQKDEIGVIIQMLDQMYSKLEDMLANN